MFLLFSQESNATAVTIAAPKGQDVTLINCKDHECPWPPQEAPVVIAEKRKVLLFFSQERNATAVIIAAPKGQDVTLINCKDQECTWPLSIPATMIGYQAGQDILVSNLACC